MSDFGPGRRLHGPLRQLIAVLQTERQALAGLDLDAVLAAAADKHALCDAIDQSTGSALDEECVALIETAQKLNEINRQVRNLVAANVAARLDALAGGPALYRAGSRSASAYVYAGARV